MIDFSNKTYAALLTEMLALVPGTYDKRDGSPIPSALGPAAYGLEGVYVALDAIQRSGYVQTAVGQSLDLLAAIAGLARRAATPAVRQGSFNQEVPLGARFSTIAGAASINFAVSNAADAQLTAEVPGILGNDYFGNILPITTLPGLTQAVLGDILIPGEDEETDDALRARLIESLNARPFGGNVASYRADVGAITGVGAVQVYPIWNGGGTVKLSILGADLLPAPAELLELVQNTIDPAPNQGLGLGLAPIGAQVTTVAPDSVTVNVAATVQLAPGYTIPQVTPLVTQALEAYLADVRAGWATQLTPTAVEYEADVFISRVVAAIVLAQGVVNASDTTLNGAAADLRLTQSGALQQVPVLGTVMLSE